MTNMECTAFHNGIRMKFAEKQTLYHCETSCGCALIIFRYAPVVVCRTLLYRRLESAI